MENRLMIESGPLPDVPDELRLVRVPEPVMVWTTMLSGQTQAPYPFPRDSPPTWEEFLHVIQSTICSNINEELGDAQQQIGLLVEKTRAERDLLLQANGHMASQMQAMEERMRGYFSAVQSESRELLEQAVISLKAPLLAIPQWDRALQAAVRDRQYTLRPASRVRGRSKSRNRLAGGGLVPSTSERVDQANRARRRNTIVPVNPAPPHPTAPVDRVSTPAPAATTTTETWPQGASDASTHAGNDSEEEDFLDSQTGSPELEVSGSEALTPFASLFNETRSFMDKARRKRAAADARNRKKGPFGLPAQNQGTAADEITQSLDTENRPQTAIPPQGGSRRLAAKAKDLRNLAQRPGPDKCTNCQRTGHFAIACPRCMKCLTYGHNESACTWCYQCQSDRCKDICIKCRGAHTHNYTCPLAQRAMAILTREPRGPWTSHSPHMQRILRQMYKVWEEVQADVDAYEEEERGTGDKGKGRADPGPAGGESSAAAGSGGKPPSPPPENNAGRQSRSWSPRDNWAGGGSGGPLGGFPGGGQPPDDGTDRQGRRRTRSRSPKQKKKSAAPGGGAPPGGDPSSSDSSDDSSQSGSEAADEADADKVQRLRKKLKGLEKKKKRLNKPDQLDIRPFDGDADDLKHFVLDVESKFDYQRKALYKDMDKIRLIVPLLEGKAKKWYENIHVNINRHAAARQGVEFDKNNKLRKWNTFFALLQSSFGQCLARDKSVQEWNHLRHRDGNIDYFLDRIRNLIYATGYTGEMVKDKIKEGLTDEMRRNWAMVQGKPEQIYPYMDALQKFAHEIERTATYTKSQNRSRGSGEASESAPKQEKKKEKKEKKEKRDKPSQPQSQLGPSKGKGKADFKDGDTELRGIPSSVIEERKKASVCLKCGKPNHTWFKCFTKDPVTRLVNSASKKKRKRDEDKKDNAPAGKMAKAERLTAGPSSETKRSPSPRFFEVEDSSSDAMNLYD